MRKFPKQFIWLSLSQLAAVGVAAFTFIYWAPWMASLPIQEALQQYPDKVNPSWKAVVIEHGVIREWRLGTPSQNPFGFSICTSAFILSICYFVGAAFFYEKKKTFNKL